MTSIQLVRVHEEPAVREIIAQAVEIAHEYAAEEAVAIAVFEKACDLLAARIPIQQMPTPIDLSKIELGR